MRCYLQGTRPPALGRRRAVGRAGSPGYLVLPLGAIGAPVHHEARQRKPRNERDINSVASRSPAGRLLSGGHCWSEVFGILRSFEGRGCRCSIVLRKRAATGCRLVKRGARWGSTMGAVRDASIRRGV